MLREIKLPRDDYRDECFLSENSRLKYDEVYKLIADINQWLETVMTLSSSHRESNDRPDGRGSDVLEENVKGRR